MIRLVGTFSAVGPLAAARTDASVTLLPKGKVLVVGWERGDGRAGQRRALRGIERPRLVAARRDAPLPPPAGKTLTVSGSGFRGISEAGGGYGHETPPPTTPSSPSPPLEGGRRTQVSAHGFSNTSVVVSVPSVLVDGYYLLNVTTNAISGGAVVFVDGPPPAPVLTAPAAFVNTATPTIAGTAEAGSTVTVSLDGAPVGTVTADALGVWSLVVASPLDQGPYTATAISVDGAGNTSPSSAPRTFTVDMVDTVAPAAPVLTAPAAFVNTTTPAISGTAEAGSTVAVTVDGTPVGMVTADASGNWSITPSSPLAQGTHTVTATATDAAGNTGPSSAPRSFTVDTVAPAAPVLTAPASLVTTPMPVISGTAEVGTTVTVEVDGTRVGTVTANDSGSWSFTPASPLAQGAHTATATATDAAGNTSTTSAPRGFTVDSEAPAPPEVVTPAEGAAVAPGELVFSGNAEAGSTVTVTVDGLVVGATTADSAGKWSVNSLYELARGRHTMTATATDAVGHVSQASSGRSFTVEPKEEPEPEPQGCGCASSPAGGMASPLGLLALWLWTRRRRLASP